MTFEESLSPVDRLIWAADTPEKMRALSQRMVDDPELQEQMWRPSSQRDREQMNAEDSCNAWVEVNSCVFTCDLDAQSTTDGVLHQEHVNRGADVRWSGPNRHWREKTHGLKSTYASGCRCSECTSAMRPYRRAQHYARQQETADSARNKGQQWTGPELEIVCRRDLSTREVAKMLGRTYAGVKNMRGKLLRDPRKQNLAGVTDEPQ